MNTSNPADYFDLLSQRILSYSFWIILIPIIYQIVSIVVKEKIKFKEVIILIVAGMVFAFIHRLIVILD
ncbi:MAG: hypothetical protein U5J96_05320 [Ignavibacteriaceae bacterium]|nr:hypothetical protein [Ignavibacteriaceae bacterium]